MLITVCLSLSLLWLRLRLDLPRIRGNWEYVFLLPHLARPCPLLCYARTNLGRRPESGSPHAHRLQCVYSIDHPHMCLFMKPFNGAGVWVSNTDPFGLVDMSEIVHSGERKHIIFFNVGVGNVWRAGETFLMHRTAFFRAHFKMCSDFLTILNHKSFETKIEGYRSIRSIRCQLCSQG